MSAPDVVVGIDMGTTATKVVAYTVDGRAIAQASHGYPLSEPHPGHAEQDPHQILDAVYRGVREVVAEIGAARVAGVSFSSAMHSIMALDADGAPLTPVVTWADTRAAEDVARLRDSGAGLALHRRTGTPIHPMSPLAKLMWFRRTDPDLVRRAATWAGIKDWVLWRMAGELVIDHSLASASGLMDIHAVRWDDEALSLAGIRADQLPGLVPTTAVLRGVTAEAARETGLPRDAAVVVGAGDGPLANLGVGAVRPGVVACSVGTSGALRVAVDRPAVDPNGGVFCYALTENRWVTGGAINNGGVVLDWVRSEIAGGDAGLSTAQLLDEAMTVPAGAGGLVMLPYLLGERAPRWGGVARGAYVGLTRAHRRAHLVRAAVEGVALQLTLVLQSMRQADLPISEIRATGGVTKHQIWRQTLASAFGGAIGMPDGHEGSGFGAALLGMEALGAIESIDVAADLVPVRDVVEPIAADAGVYGELLPVFERLYGALLPANITLQDIGSRLPLAHGA
ncbi:gluconokinase [Microbacterium sp. ZXX196]|uniref:gluconokinase n=1 Tax=Microbacterium sp. ZXX196 TaxID=2609291 RepID=UPI0012B860FD|nr:gluconokinase [Microbacterium sp. ZXX196]MTE22815.1 carbohydrate kinase [Microbacterium sp. ZXX196]